MTSSEILAKRGTDGIWSDGSVCRGCGGFPEEGMGCQRKGIFHPGLTCWYPVGTIPVVDEEDENA
jgi:hypothetical protein